MIINYNKWGVVTGINGLALAFLVAPSFYVLTFSFQLSLIFSVLGYFTILLSILLNIATLIFGVLSIWIGDKKKTALILGLTYLLLFMLAAIILLS